MNSGETIRCIYNLFIALSNDMKNIVEIVVAIIGGICALKGISYLQTLKEKRVAAIYSFWSQLSVRISELYSFLDSNHSVINGLYSENVRMSWSGDNSIVSDDSVNKFYQNAIETLAFIKNVPDQMPAYPNWMSDYQSFIKFLITVLQYDITDLEKNYLYNDNTISIEDRDKYCNNICNVMDRLLTGMQHEQEETGKLFWPE